MKHTKQRWVYFQLHSRKYYGPELVSILALRRWYW